MRITVEIPDEYVAQLVPYGCDAARLLLEESVAGAFRDHRLSTEQVRRILGFGTQVQADAFLQKHEAFDYTISDLQKDMETLDRVLGQHDRSRRH